MLKKPIAILIAAGALSLGPQAKASFYADADDYTPGGQSVASGNSFTGTFDIVPAVNDGTSSFTVSAPYSPSSSIEDFGKTYTSVLGFKPGKELVTEGEAKFWLHSDTPGKTIEITMNLDNLKASGGGTRVVLEEAIGVSVIAKLNIDGKVDYTVQNNGTSAIKLDYAYLDATTVPVPESSTYIAGALLLLPFGASALRSIRRSRLA